MNILISSFDAFENMKFVKLFKTLPSIKRVCFIASTFSLHEKNEQYAKILKNLFYRQLDLDVEIHIVDDRMSKEDAKAFVQRSDCIFLAGGDTYCQYQSLVDYDLIKSIKEHSKLVMGMSAGALNMCEMVILPKDMDRYVTEEITYEGIGRVDFSILPHFNEFDASFIENLHEEILYGIDDDGFLYYANDEIILDQCHII